MSTGSGERPPLVEARGLTKTFGKVRALDGLDLVASTGEVLAILGPNGAGKSTFVRAVATLLIPTSGTLHVTGIDAVRQPKQVRRVIGLAGQSASVEEALTGQENLVMVARLFGHDRTSAGRRAQQVLEQIDLSDAADRLVRTYSGGMRRRLDLGASLVGSPRLLLLDEPTTGLDPRSRQELWDTIRGLVAGGTDVLLTTQYLEEADQLANHVVIVDHGRVIAAGTPAALKAQAGRDVLELRPSDVADLAAAATALAPLGAGEPHLDESTRRVTVPVEDGADRLVDAVRVLADHDIAIEDLALRRPTLDEVFLTLTGHPTTDAPAAPDAATASETPDAPAAADGSGDTPQPEEASA